MPAGGAGWGGPAKGTGGPLYAEGNRPDMQRAMQGKIKAEALRMLLAGDIPEVAETWRSIMKDRDQPAAARIAAAAQIAERVEGKVANVNLNADAGPLDALSDDELRRGIDELRARIAGADGSGTRAPESGESVN
jgi:hypothetical protein